VGKGRTDKRESRSRNQEERAEPGRRTKNQEQRTKDNKGQLTNHRRNSIQTAKAGAHAVESKCKILRSEILRSGDRNELDKLSSITFHRSLNERRLEKC
jgi:hypothetical protein